MPPANVRSQAAASSEAFDWILRDVSFTNEPGETVAIAAIPARKTTIISSLMRFADIQSVCPH